MNLTVRPFSLATLRALAQGDAAAASEHFGQLLPAELGEESWVWQHYADLLSSRPEVDGWITEAVLQDGVVVGYAGFHEPPDESGEVELGYTVLSPYRQRGIATASVALFIARAEARGVRRLTGYVAPDNEPSMKVLRTNGFTYVKDVDGKQGTQLMFERKAGDD